MNGLQKHRLAMAVVAVLVGVGFAAVAAYYAAVYFIEVENPLRDEYLVGVALGLLYSFPAFALAALLAASVKKVISRTLYCVLSVPALIVGVPMLLHNLLR